MTTPLIRRARAADVPAIVRLLADDKLGAAREGDPDDPVYGRAFAAIEASPDNAVFVLDADGVVVGCAQLTVIPGLSRRGNTRVQIEAVRVAADRRGQGLGAMLIEHLVAMAREAGCGSVQLTSDKSRIDAHRFYERLGFKKSHDGFKLDLTGSR
jgi:ribosomal protein S18 acetylase RimI-like enzyme